MKLVLDRNSLEIEVYMEGDSLPAFWLAPYEPGEEVGEDEEVMEAPDWVAEEVGEDHPLYLVPRALVPELVTLGFRPGTSIGVFGEICPICGGILSPSSAWANWPWTSRKPGERPGGASGPRKARSPRGVTPGFLGPEEARPVPHVGNKFSTNARPSSPPTGP